MPYLHYSRSVPVQRSESVLECNWHQAFAGFYTMNLKSRVRIINRIIETKKICHVAVPLQKLITKK